MRFFFHVHNDIEAPDEEGADFPDRDAAVRHALDGARALAADQVRQGRLCLSHRIDVTDEAGSLVAAVTFADAVAVEG